jgi:hypothetical protein
MYKFYSECCVCSIPRFKFKRRLHYVMRSLRPNISGRCKKPDKWHLSCVVDADLLSAEQAMVDSRVFKAQDS